MIIPNGDLLSGQVVTITSSAIELKVRVWINSVNKEDQFRSQVLLSIYQRFKETASR